MIRIARILFPTDFSDAAAPAAEYACVLAERFGAELHLLHVVPEVLQIVTPDYGAALWTDEAIERAEASARESLRLLPGGEWRERLRVVRATLRGPAHAGIVRYAREQGCDLVVCGTHGRSGLMHALLGSVAERVVRAAPCPVLTVRPDVHRGTNTP